MDKNILKYKKAEMMDGSGGATERSPNKSSKTIKFQNNNNGKNGQMPLENTLQPSQLTGLNNESFMNLSNSD